MVQQPSIVWNLQRSAQRWPGRVAITAGANSVSYADLWNRVGSAARFLSRNGLTRGERVALVFENSIDYVVLYYGVLAAGGVAVALNAAAKARDHVSWLRHSGATWLFSRAGNPEARAAITSLAGGIRHEELDAADGTSWVAPDAGPFPQATGEATPAAIMYTSGTTGSPKGVLLSHGNLAANAAAIATYLQLTEQDRTVNVLPFYYSYGSSVLHSYLAAGGELVLVENLVYPHLVVEALARHRATGFAGVPSTFLLLLSRGRLAEHDLSSLRYLTQAGGPMAPAVMERVREALPHASLVIMYGQTEATARISWLPPERLRDKLGSVGVAIPGVSLQVVREDGSPAAPRETGEVRVRGANVMLGYWNDPQATSGVLKDGWLHTGDMGHLDEDGFLFLSGRRSDMIKTGAHRVYPQDIESVIMELPGVAEVAVVGVEDEVLGEAVKAIVVPAQGAAPDVQQIKAHCRANLAMYKIPKVVEFRASLPRTGSGKVIRQALTQGKYQ